MPRKVQAKWREFVYGSIAAEISTLSRYYDKVIQYQPRQEDDGFLLELIQNGAKSVSRTIDEFPDLTAERNERSLVLLNGNINHDFDIQNTLSTLKSKLSRTSRVLLVAYNPYFKWLYSLANALGVRKGEAPQTFVTTVDLKNIARLAGFEVVRVRPSVYTPFSCAGFGNIVNAVLSVIPFIKWLSLTVILTLRPLLKETEKPSLSILIPARNEKGNIENALRRIPDISGGRIEVIFVEGHSSDGTWEEIQRVLPLYQNRFSLKAFQQTGKGKSDAVRLGFSRATGDLFVILDADLTMPPELLGRFYDAYCEGHADFVNGSRLVYPMEGQAMRFLNHLGNVFFAKVLSAVLDTALGDSLCGTKLVTRHDYDRIVRWRRDFGDFDPFGDFELLFPAAILALGIVDIPIRYRDRTYGSTQIHRFRHGLMLLKMTLVGLRRVKMGQRAICLCQSQ